jgi:AcrB/AcrD/AcrF family
MIGRLIGASARNIMLVLIATVFAVAAGLYAIFHLPLDAIPDLSDTQVIVYTEYPGQAPQVVEDQVTYPLASAMLTAPKSHVVRGFSYFGVSFVYVIFEDGTDIYWARSRVLEYLNAAARRLPGGVTPTLGPDATGVGWVYQYALLAKDRTLAELRTLQDWYLRYGLAKAEGVAEVASVGGFVKQYNVVIDPQRLRSFGIPLSKVRDAIRVSNTDVGGRTVELSEFEFVVRGRGYLKGVPDLQKIVLKNEGGTPVLLQDVARVELGPDERRGLTELNGEGEVASGIVLQRFGANALDVIDSTKKRLAEMASSLPKGVDIQAVYDRSTLIHAAIETLRRTLLEESAIVALVCVLFLLHVRSALVAILMLPVGVLMSFAAMKALGLGSNIMSLGGIAIAIGAMVDAAQASGAHTGGQTAPADPHRSRDGGRPRAVLQPAHHHGVVPADLHAGGTGRSPVQPTRLHQDVRDGGGGALVCDARPRADGRFRARTHHRRAQESAELLPDLGLPAGHQGGAESQDLDPASCRSGLRHHIVAGAATRHRVHAQSQRGHVVLHADHPARHLGDQGGRAVADAGPHHQDVPRSGVGVRQGGPCRNGDRPGADRDVRDGHQSQAED